MTAQAKNADLEVGNRRRTTRKALLVSALWLAVVAVFSQLGLFESGDNPPLAFGIAALVPLVVFTVLYLGSKRFAVEVSGWSLSFLTWAQSVRAIAGFIFIAYFMVGQLPGFFAIPAGLGDILAGVTAPFVAMLVVNRKPLRKYVYVAWTLYGMADFVDAMGRGALSTVFFARQLNIQPASNPAIATLPLSLIPLFGVPMLFIFEILALLKVRRIGKEA